MFIDFYIPVFVHYSNIPYGIRIVATSLQYISAYCGSQTAEHDCISNGLNKHIHNDFSDGEALNVSRFSDWPGYKPHWSMKVYREGKEIEEQEQRRSPSDIETEYCHISPQFCC